VVTPQGRGSDERAWARELRVVYAPTLVFLDAGGREVFRSEGYLKPFHLAATLDYVASGAYRDEPDFQRYVQKRADAARAAGKRVDLWD
jgi:thioredoxin-related protein